MTIGKDLDTKLDGLTAKDDAQAVKDDAQAAKDDAQDARLTRLEHPTATPPVIVVPPVVPPVVVPASGALKYVGAVSTTVGAPAGTEMWYGKHVQGRSSRFNGKLYLNGGDGAYHQKSTDFKYFQMLNAVISYDPAKGYLFKEETPAFGNKADATAQFYPDGCTWIHRLKNDTFVSMPGYQQAYVAALDPLGIMKRGVIHEFNPATGAMRELGAIGNPDGTYNWVGEHWGGLYDYKRDRAVINCSGSGETGGLRWYEFENKTTPWGKANLKACPGITPFMGIGKEIVTQAWNQHYNGVTDEAILLDLYRGFVYGVNMETLQPRIIASVPKYRNDAPGEPIGTIEAGFAFSEKRQLAFVTYSYGPQYIAGDEGDKIDIVIVDLKTGLTTSAAYPVPDFDVIQQWTAADYNDFHDELVLWDSIIDTGPLARKAGRNLCRYRFDGAAPPVVVVPPVVPPVVVDPPVIPPPPGPGPSTMPAWMKGKAPYQISALPGPNLAAFLTRADIESCGAKVQDAPLRGVDWMTNRLGHRSPGANKYSFDSLYDGFSGLAFDTNGDILWSIMDAQNPGNMVYRYSYLRDVPVNTLAVRGTHVLDMRHQPPLITEPFPDTGMQLNGEPQGGHKYWNQHIASGLLIGFARNQFWPLDQGSSALTYSANLASGVWEKGSGIVASLRRADGSVIGEGADLRQWKQQHPATGDVYMIRGTSLWVWRNFPANKPEKLCDFPDPGQYGADLMNGSINATEGYILFEGWNGAGVDDKNHPGRRANRVVWLFDLTTNKLTTTGASIIGPAAEQIDGQRYNTSQWIPELGKFIFYRCFYIPEDKKTGQHEIIDNDYYTIRRTGALQFTAELLPMTGDRHTVGACLGGMLGKVRRIETKWGPIVVSSTDLRSPVRWFPLPLAA